MLLPCRERDAEVQGGANVGSGGCVCTKGQRVVEAVGKLWAVDRPCGDALGVQVEREAPVPVGVDDGLSAPADLHDRAALLALHGCGWMCDALVSPKRRERERRHRGSLQTSGVRRRLAHGGIQAGSLDDGGRDVERVEELLRDDDPHLCMGEGFEKKK